MAWGGLDPLAETLLQAASCSMIGFSPLADFWLLVGVDLRLEPVFPATSASLASSSSGQISAEGQG